LLSQSPFLSKDFNTTGYVIPVVIVILTVLVFVAFTILFYKKRSKFWKWTPRDVTDNNKQMDIELVDMR
jgi:hypothetical protein